MDQVVGQALATFKRLQAAHERPADAGAGAVVEPDISSAVS